MKANDQNGASSSDIFVRRSRIGKWDETWDETWDFERTLSKFRSTVQQKSGTFILSSTCDEF